MRRPALVLLLIATPAAAAPHGPGCQLSTRECAAVARELAIDDMQAADDDVAFGYPTDLQVRLALIHRQAARMQARIAHLPPRIGAEFARLRACQSADHLAAVKGTVNDDPQCQ